MPEQAQKTDGHTSKPGIVSILDQNIRILEVDAHIQSLQVRKDNLTDEAISQILRMIKRDLQAVWIMRFGEQWDLHISGMQIPHQFSNLIIREALVKYYPAKDGSFRISGISPKGEVYLQ